MRHMPHAFFEGEALADSLAQAAIEDFDFGKRKFDKHGFDIFQHMMEHTYSTPHSLYMAAMSWSASQLYRLTHKECYARLAAKYIRYVLQCQSGGSSRGELSGFFYRDERHQVPVHSIHQSREHLFAMLWPSSFKPSLLMLTAPCGGNQRATMATISKVCASIPRPTA